MEQGCNFLGLPNVDFIYDSMELGSFVWYIIAPIEFHKLGLW